MTKSVFQEASDLLKQTDLRAHAKGLELLRAEAERDPNDPKGWFEYAGGFDFLGREDEALPLYEKAMALGVDRLPSEDQPKIYLQMGSTLRNLKRHEEAVQLLRSGVEKFPDHDALRMFHALALYSSGNTKDAAWSLFNLVLATHDSKSIKEYSRALYYYVNELE